MQLKGLFKTLLTSWRGLILFGAIERRDAPGFGSREDILDEFDCLREAQRQFATKGKADLVICVGRYCWESP